MVIQFGTVLESNFYNCDIITEFYWEEMLSSLVDLIKLF